jgi:hypothetical protein
LIYIYLKGDRKRNRESAFLEKETGKETEKVGFGKGDRKRSRERAFWQKEIEKGDRKKWI